MTVHTKWEILVQKLMYPSFQGIVALKLYTCGQVSNPPFTIKISMSLRYTKITHSLTHSIALARPGTVLLVREITWLGLFVINTTFNNIFSYIVIVS
jgi:hypothetical protein